MSFPGYDSSTPLDCREIGKNEMTLTRWSSKVYSIDSVFRKEEWESSRIAEFLQGPGSPGVQFNTVPKSIPKIVPKNVPKNPSKITAKKFKK